MITNNKVWVLLDDRPGNNNQSLGVANALGLPFETKQIKYNKWARLPNFIKGSSLLGLEDDAKKIIHADFPDIVIGAGRKLGAVARYIKKISPKTMIVQIMHPGHLCISDFDLVALPNHDKVIINHKNITRFSTSPHTITTDKLNDAKNMWQEKLAAYPAPFTSVFIGGSTKNRKFTTEMATELGNILDKISKSLQGTILITTSRRTGIEQEKIIKNAISGSCYFYSWADGGDNPYFGFMAMANNIIVTGDSISMASESTSMGVPVYIFNPNNFVSPKHARFIQSLFDNKLAQKLCTDTIPEIMKSYDGQTPINSADKIAAEINKLLALK